jgi:hypothetical protein
LIEPQRGIALSLSGGSALLSQSPTPGKNQPVMGRYYAGTCLNARLSTPWESLDALKKWHDSPEFQAALKVGEKYAKYNIIAVNGVAQ